jgi:hypothetical protein
LENDLIFEEEEREEETSLDAFCGARGSVRAGAHESGQHGVEMARCRLRTPRRSFEVVFF